MKRVFLTGATGSMGGEAMNQLLERESKFHVVVLNRPSEKNKELFKKFENNPNLTIKWGDLTNYEDVLECISGCDYVIHCAAFVSPAADRYPVEAMKINYGGTVNIIKAIKAQSNTDQIKLLYVGTVAETGDRMPPIHWGRVGDPLKPSIHDYYAVSKIAAERAVIESGLKYWVSVRQSGMASIKEFSLHEGIMFHQPLNNVLEWVTAYDSGVLCANVCEDWVDESFWRHIYNIGGGENCRLTNYELMSEMMKEIGIEDIRKTFEPSWYATANFHGQWYLDSDKLNDFLHFRSESMQDFVKLYGETMKKSIPAQATFTTEQLIKQVRNDNQSLSLSDTGTLNWIINDEKEHIDAFYISKEKWAEIPSWDKFVLFRPSNDAIHIEHGYDESKSPSELTLDDVKQAASYRGGSCDSSSMKTGDWTTKLEFTCAFGHKFQASPCLALEAGHWCDQCGRESWNYHEEAKRNPFFAQIWNPIHNEKETPRKYIKIVKETDV